MRIVWTAAARRDRRSAITYLSDLNPVAAIRLEEALVLAADSLSTFPYRGRPGLVGGTRELATVPPYLLIYEVQKDLVCILRIWHAARDR